ncbi:hypothetical protein KC354_g10386 [Hortaea werneckii]|uniref:Uncharacterized protein n=1 Tax=Hortaea werneckii TaxID=91943 RepID=A0A3M7ECY0_HORWE|nr:hypothetical protein KC354_g10386 [Hortaea werneckii]RMY74478.1 hypothetical protein D0863_03189 [Hortaea werneckii]
MTFQNLENPPPAFQPLPSDTICQSDTYEEDSKLDTGFGKVLTMRQSQKNKQKPTDKDVVKTEPDRKRKDDLIAFLPPVEEPGRDFISSLPTETFHEILSYLILDHDPDRGLKLEALKRRGFKDQPHVFLSLSVLSKHFRDNVESFCLHYLTQFKEICGFQPAVQLHSEHRHSTRLAAKPKKDSRIFRVLLVKHLQGKCISCNVWCRTRATMATGVACCLDRWMEDCEEEAFPTIISLAEAMDAYDLRDHMLLKARSPGPSAEHMDLPTIPYGTFRIRVGIFATRVCYCFFLKDVLTIAKMVHPNKSFDQRTPKQSQARASVLDLMSDQSFE